MMLDDNSIKIYLKDKEDFILLNFATIKTGCLGVINEKFARRINYFEYKERKVCEPKLFDNLDEAKSYVSLNRNFLSEPRIYRLEEV